MFVYCTGMPTGSHKKRRTTFCGRLEGELPLPVRSFKDPPILSEIRPSSSDLDESQESIFRCKISEFPPFGGRLAFLTVDQLVCCVLAALCQFTLNFLLLPLPTGWSSTRWIFRYNATGYEPGRAPCLVPQRRIQGQTGSRFKAKGTRRRQNQTAYFDISRR